jgi:hypothetical protein
MPVRPRFSAPIQTGPGAYPASCTMGTGFLFRGHSDRGVMLSTGSILRQGRRKNTAIPPPPCRSSWPVLERTLPFGARGGAVGWSSTLQGGRLRVRFNDIFYWLNPSGRTMALGSTQSLTEMCTRSISCGGTGGRCIGLTTLPPSRAGCLKI